MLAETQWAVQHILAAGCLILIQGGMNINAMCSVQSTNNMDTNHWELIQIDGEQFGRNCGYLFLFLKMYLVPGAEQ